VERRVVEAALFVDQRQPLAGELGVAKL